jgi:hypothetical protein
MIHFSKANRGTLPYPHILSVANTESLWMS